jgi:hypothetical protein
LELTIPTDSEALEEELIRRGWYQGPRLVASKLEAPCRSLHQILGVGLSFRFSGSEGYWAPSDTEEDLDIEHSVCQVSQYD